MYNPILPCLAASIVVTIEDSKVEVCQMNVTLANFPNDVSNIRFTNINIVKIIS